MSNQSNGLVLDASSRSIRTYNGPENASREVLNSSFGDTIEGTLHKLKPIAGWTKAACSVQNALFTTPTRKTPVEDITVAACTSDVKGKSHCFTCKIAPTSSTGGGKMYTFSCASAAEREAWLSAIRMAQMQRRKESQDATVVEAAIERQRVFYGNYQKQAGSVMDIDVRDRQWTLLGLPDGCSMGFAHDVALRVLADHLDVYDGYLVLPSGTLPDHASVFCLFHQPQPQQQSS